MGAPPYRQLPIDHKDFTKRCPIANGTQRCRNMRSCDYQRYREAHPDGGKEVEYLIHNLTGRAGELKAETRRKMARRLHELSDCLKHQDPVILDDSVRKTLEQLDRTEELAPWMKTTSEPTSHPVQCVPRPGTPTVGFASVGGLATPPESTRSSLESAGAVPSPSTAEQARDFWGVPPHPTHPRPTKIKPEPLQTPLPAKHSARQLAPSQPSAPRRRATGPVTTVDADTLLNQLPAVSNHDPAVASYLTRIEHLEAENQQLREELAQANRRAETEKVVAEAATRAANKWRAHYERYKGEIWAFFRQSQRVEDREPNDDGGNGEAREDDGYAGEE